MRSTVARPNLVPRPVIQAPSPESCQNPWIDGRPALLSGEQLAQLEHVRLTREWLADELDYALTDFTHADLAAQLHPRHHGAGHISNQFEYLLTSVIEPENTDEQVVEQLAALQATTLGEELVLHRVHEQIRHKRLLPRLRAYWNGLELGITVEENQRDIDRANRYQFSRNSPKRPLDQCVGEGVSVMVSDSDQEMLAAIINAMPRDGAVPITEHLKNHKVLEASGFMAGKVSLAVHDAVDHLWLFQLVEDESLFEKFEDLWSGLGNPERTDIYKREGEAIASIGFGTRYWHNLEVGFVPLVTINQLHAHFEGMLLADILQNRHMKAFDLLRHLSTQPVFREAQSLTFVFSNYLVELNEQRRKFGAIQYRNPHDGVVVGELNPWSADYLSFFVEVHHLLCRSTYKHRYTTFRVNLAIEEWFYSGKAAAGEEFKIEVEPYFYWRENAAVTAAPVPNIPLGRVQWIANHPGFTAIRDALRW